MCCIKPFITMTGVSRAYMYVNFFFVHRDVMIRTESLKLLMIVKIHKNRIIAAIDLKIFPMSAA